MLNNYPKKNSHTEWEEDFVKTLNKYAPLKTKVIRGNHKSFITYENISFEKEGKYLK